MAAVPLGYISSNTAGTSNLLWTNIYTSDSTVTITPSIGFANGGYSIEDPLNRKPRPETPEQWLRRRVREVQWAPA